MNTRETFFIVDGTSLIYRAYYAIRELRNSKGLSTNAVFGFVKSIQKMIRERQPDRLVIAFDAKGPTFRHAQFHLYKAHRKPMPEDLILQLPWIKEIVRAYRIPILEIQGVEADDAIASLATRVRQDFDVFIVSPDKDMLQLAGPALKVIPNPSEQTVLDEAAVTDLYGVGPSLIPDLLALCGDASDNIPGVAGIGPKSASALLKEFGTLEDVFTQAWEQRGRISKTTLLKNEADARMGKALALLKSDVPLDIDIETGRRLEPDKSALVRIFQELEFRDLLREVMPSDARTLLFTTVDERSNPEELRAAFGGAKKMALSVSATGRAAIAFSERVLLYMSVAGGGPHVEILKEALSDLSLEKCAYDLKKTMMMLHSFGLPLQGPGFDVMTAAFLVNPAIHYRSLEELADHFLEYGLGSAGKPEEERCVKEALAVLQLESRLQSRLEASGQMELFRNIEMPLVEVLVSMEKTGIPINAAHLSSLSAELHQTLDGLEEKIHRMAGTRFNLNSPRELARVLFETLKLPATRKTKTGFSTSADVLQSLSGKHPIIAELLEYRKISKLLSTYVDVLPRLVHPDTGRIHTTFHQNVAETGRLASSGPNLQNIPVRTEMGRTIRRAFVAPDAESLLLSADYSQIELRILAHFSEDPGLIAAFEKDEDIHRWTAHTIFSKSLDAVTDEERAKAKVINFGILYGMGFYGLSQELGISGEEAQRFMNLYFERFSHVRHFIQRTLETARQRGYVTTLYNRRRYLPDLASPQPQVRQLAERMAMNTPIQGTAADLIKIAMIQIHRRLQDERFESRLILQIHDELIFTVPRSEMEIIADIVSRHMEHAAELKVRLKVNIKSGYNWAEL